MPSRVMSFHREKRETKTKRSKQKHPQQKETDTQNKPAKRNKPSTKKTRLRRRNGWTRHDRRDSRNAWQGYAREIFPLSKQWHYDNSNQHETDMTRTIHFYNGRNSSAQIILPSTTCFCSLSAQKQALPCVVTGQLRLCTSFFTADVSFRTVPQCDYGQSREEALPCVALKFCVHTSLQSFSTSDKMKGPKTGLPEGTTFDPKRVHFWIPSEIYLLCARVQNWALSILNLVSPWGLFDAPLKYSPESCCSQLPTYSNVTDDIATASWQPGASNSSRFPPRMLFVLRWLQA